MIIIAFSNKTSKILPRLLCKHFRHCAPIVVEQGQMPYMLQFTKPGHVYKIDISFAALKRLQAHGWKLVYKPGTLPSNFNPMHAFSCVNLCKRALRIHAPLIQKPDGLYRRILQQ